MHYGVKGQTWGIRQYQDQDGNYTDEGIRHYRELRKKKEALKNSDEAIRAKKVAELNHNIDRKLMSQVAETAAQTAQEIRRRSEQDGHTWKAISTQETLSAAVKMLDALGLKPTTEVAVIRVGDKYVRGNRVDLKYELENLISRGNDMSDVEIVGLYEGPDTTVVTYDVNGRVTSEKRTGDDDIEKNKNKRKPQTKIR